MIFEPSHLMPNILNSNAIGLIFYKDEILIESEVQTPFILIRNLSSLLLLEHNSYYIGRLNGSDLYAITIPTEEHFSELKQQQQFSFKPLKNFLEVLDESERLLIRRSKHLLYWHQTNQYCGQCGTETLPSEKEIAKLCSVCNRIIYPHGSPAIMVLIKKDQQILLARSPHFSPGLYSALAGFVEPGETAIDAVHREVKEEVGIKIKNVQYFDTQYWPFPDIFMVGFTAEYESGEIEMNPNEIEDAKWFDKNNLPLLPTQSSIAWKLINNH